MNRFLKNFDRELDELEVQISLGEKELEDAFEKGKTNFKSFVDEASKTVEGLGNTEAATNLRTKLDELRVQLALGRAEGKDAFEAQKDALDKKLNETQQAYKAWEGEAGDKANDLKGAFAHRVEHFRTQTDMMKVQLHLGVADAKDEWEEAKKEVSTKINDMKRFLAERNEEGEKRWEEFSGEMTEAYSHIKGAMKKLFS